jgi:glc operon protein GlcG
VAEGFAHERRSGEPVQGGLPLVAEGKVVGGIGVSGVKSSDDERIARAGAALLE